ncbi:CU044_5270 family protein [Streptosporangium sp. NPDC002524]|uniref:CU044_5270 family protein n=1 Tax=Streptosporangium sp. NPDC002524 TaxID=3154537 RepID=UPI00332FCEC6
MTSEFNDIKRLLGALDPVSSDEFVGAAHDAAGRAALHHILVGVSEVTTPAPPVAAPRWTRRRFVVVGAGAVTGIAALALHNVNMANPRVTPPMLNYRLSGASMPATSSARAVLIALAAVADRQPTSPRPANAAFSHITTNEWDLNVSVADGESTSAIVPKVVEQWSPTTAGGSYRRLERRGDPELFRVGGRRSAAAVTNTAPLSDMRMPVTSDLGPWNLQPASPRRLRDQLLQASDGTTQPQTYRLIQAIRTLYSHHVVPAALAAGLWRVLAEQPDLRFLGEVTDRAGRSGHAIAFDADLSLPKRWVLIISRDTGDLLTVEETLTTEAGNLNVDVPAVIGYEMFLAQEWTPTAG